MNTNFVVITSIFAPTEAVEKIASFPEYNLVVVGDKKSPEAWACNNVTYLSVAQQEEAGFSITGKLPYNHYGRKLVGYLYAMQQGATCIVDTDDDNIPYDGWVFPQFEGSYDAIPEDSGFVNMYKYFTTHHVWPRGYPLQLIKRAEEPKPVSASNCRVGIWQGLADSDPDVDAIYRLVDNTEIYFDKRAPLVLKKGALCPFNSQNTAVRKELFALLYLPSFVTFRFTDILRGLVAQPILWNHGYELGFIDATVKQLRNAHNYLRDFESEIPCYLYPDDVIDIVSKAITPGVSVSRNLLEAYTALKDKAIVTDDEIGLLQLWLNDVEQLTK